MHSRRDLRAGNPDLPTAACRTPAILLSTGVSVRFDACLLAARFAAKRAAGRQASNLTETQVDGCWLGCGRRLLVSGVAGT